MRKEPRATGFKDKNGRSIYKGDLLKQLHFKCANRRLPHQYLYHLVVWDGSLCSPCKAEPVQSFALGEDGGSFWITDSLEDAEIVAGPSLFGENKNLIMWCERR